MKCVPRTSDPYTYLREVVHSLQGWLEDYTAIRTMDMLDWQAASGIEGPLLEIGVYGGRYFSLLLRAAKHGERVVGIDTFQYISKEAVAETLAALTDTPPMLVSKPSTQCTAEELLDYLGAAPRFVSIDGSHDFQDVFWDLRMTEKILSARGIVAADDFLNPLTLGVNEAINLFFCTPRSLSPFAYIANKLFLCRPPMVDTMMDVIEQKVLADTVEPRSKRFREEGAKARHFVEQVMWRRKFLTIP